MSDRLDDAIRDAQIIGAAQGELATSYLRRVLRQGALIGAQWALASVDSRAVAVIQVEPEAPDLVDTGDTAVPPPEDPEPQDAQLREERQARHIFALLGEKGFDTTAAGRDTNLGFINRALSEHAGREVKVESTKFLTVRQADIVIAALVALPDKE